MKKANIKKPIFALSLTTLLSVALGYGEWVIIASQSLKKPDISQEKRVCYIGNTYYTTVEAALTAAEGNPGADTIYVIPGADPTLAVNPETGKDTFVLPSNDKMIVAFYSDAGTKTIYANSKKGVNPGGTDLSLKNTLTIGSGATLQIDGTLETSGKLFAGDGGAKYAGNTFGDYTKIVLNANAKIICNGTINCYGYIEEATTDNGSSIEMANGSSLYMPFIIRDFRGGTSSSAINSSSKGCFLFNQYELKNISVRTTLDYGSKFFAWGNVNMGGSVQHLELNMVGYENSFLFQMTNSTYSKILYYHVPDTTANNSNPLKGKSEISFVGGANFNSISINLSSYNVNSSKYYFPFNFYFSFKFVNPPQKDSSIFSIPHKTKIMTGCNFEIGENCNVTIGDMVIYNVYNDDNKNIGGTKYPSLEPARFWNKGTINATNLAGCVINDGIINISGSKTITSYEAWEQLGVVMRRWATIKMHYSEFTSSFVANNNRVLIFKKNIAKEMDINYSYNSTNLSGYYTDYIASGSTIKISNWKNIKSISINGANYSQNNTYAVSNSTKVEILPTTGWF